MQEFVERNAYLAEKGKQAATKEDIEQITRLIESVKAEHSTLLELWKLELSKKGTIHRLRIEKEFETLSRAWDALAELRFATEQLFPPGLQPRVEGDRRSQAEKRVNAFYQAYDDYMNAIYKNKIFFRDDLCKLLFDILQQAKQVEIPFRHGIDAESGFIPPKVYVQVEDVMTGFLRLVEEASLRINKQLDI
ncbi:MAG TPA: hypothetical protein VKC61_07280 [Pyrinomonadaceae bacterium]|nr:hypothetical protein [Pyrinomonadaceae bacterium]